MADKTRPIIDVVDSLLNIYQDMTKKEVEGCQLSALKTDLVNFRDALAEFGTAVVRLGIELATAKTNTGMNFLDLLSKIMGSSIPQSNQFINMAIMMAELQQQYTQDEIKQSKLLASMVNTTLSSSSLISGLKVLKEFLKKI